MESFDSEFNKMRRILAVYVTGMLANVSLITELFIKYRYTQRAVYIIIYINELLFICSILHEICNWLRS